MKKELIEKIINRSLKLTMESYFGDGSYVKVTNLQYIKSKDNFLVSITVYVTDVENSSDFFPDGLEILVSLAWKVLSRNKTIITTSSIEYVN